MFHTNSQGDSDVTTKQVRIDTGLHHMLKVRAAQKGTSIKKIIEDLFEDTLAVEPEEGDSSYGNR